MATNRLCLFIGAFLLALAGFLSFGVIKGPDPLGFALFGFAFWCLSGAV